MRLVECLRISTALGLSLAAAALAPQASAQSQTEAEAAPTENAGLEDIIVTAQRRQESSQKAAIAITALGAEQLARANVTNATQLTSIAPALQINSVYGATSTFYLRGVGNFVTNALSDTAVIVNLDGVPLGRPTGVQGLFFDLERVEVLKGPQGTLYGRNATGGAINIITARPKIGETSGYANFTYGNYDTINLNGAANLSLSDNTALRIAGQWSKRDGTYTDGTGDENIVSLRASLRSELSDRLTVTLTGDYTSMRGRGPGSTVRGLNRDDRIGLADPRVGAIYATTLNFPAGTFLNPLPNNDYQRNDMWGVTLQADLETSLGTVSLIPAYRHARLDLLTSASSFQAPTYETDQQASVELRLVSPAGRRLAYVAGLFYFNESDDAVANYNQQYFSAYTSFQPKTNSYAAYGRLTYSVTDALRITGGVRYTIDSRSARIDSVNAVVVCPTLPTLCLGAQPLPVQLGVPAAYFNPDGSVRTFIPGNGGGSFISNTPSLITPSKTFRRATWRAGVEYDVGERSLLYATFETGYKSGGFFSSIDDPSFRPESISAFTIGSKNRFFDNRLQLNLEAFWWTYKDQQFSHFKGNSVGGTEFVTENIGKTRIRGFEVEMRGQVTPTTTLNGTVQYLDARNIDFRYQAPAAVGVPVTGCPVTGPVAGTYTVKCSGLRPANSPEWTFTAGLEQRIPLGNAGELTFTAATRYQSGSFVGTDLLPQSYQPGYFMTDLQLEYVTANKQFRIAGFVNNLENNNVVGFSQPHPRAGGLIIEGLRLPRMYGVRAGVRF
jgi:iron complex outermembrane receptor protein